MHRRLLVPLSLSFVTLALVAAVLAPASATANSARGSSSVREGPPLVPTKGTVRLADLPWSKPSAPHIQIGPFSPSFLGTHKRAVSGPVKPSSGTAPRSAVSTRSGPSMPPPNITFAGLNFASNGAGWPPDTVGDVGPTEYVQAVNTSFGVFSKSDGTQLAATTFNNFWTSNSAGGGTPCANENQGDPTVAYDPINDRFIVADFGFAISGGNLVPPFYECIAVSQTNDPTGTWYFFTVRTDSGSFLNDLADYPKMGIWPDGLYMSANMFAEPSGAFAGVRVWAFNRSELESGSTLHPQLRDLSGAGCNNNPPTACYFTVLPANLRGTAPPTGRVEFFVSSDCCLYDFDVWKFHVDWTTPGNSTFTGPTHVSQSTYFLQSNGDGLVDSPQNNLDALQDRMMMQAQYVNIDGAETLWVNHTVLTGSSVLPFGVQWAQIGVDGGAVQSSPIEQQIYGNLGSDGISRWMGSLAVDESGDMALGYSASSSTQNPDIRYNGRLSTDTFNALPQGEATLQAGGGSQSGNYDSTTDPLERWGDYSAMTLDPNGCAFWYTNEYYATDGQSWLTRIGSFTIPQCGTITPSYKPDGKIKFSSDASYLGNNIYNATATNQTRTVNGTRSSTKTFDIAVQNDGPVTDSYKLKGAAGNANFTVKFLAGLTGTTNITTAVVNGTYVLSNILAGGTKYIRLQITVKSSAAIGSTFGDLVTATSRQNTIIKDAVKGVVKVVT